MVAAPGLVAARQGGKVPTRVYNRFVPEPVRQARVAGPVTASAHAPTKARRAAGFFVDISLLRYVGG